MCFHLKHTRHILSLKPNLILMTLSTHLNLIHISVVVRKFLFFSQFQDIGGVSRFIRTNWNRIV